jgi:pantothenate kinase
MWFQMADASIEVSGPAAERWGADLRAALAGAAGPGESVAPVEVERSAELVVAIIGLVFTGISTAKTIWDWWAARRAAGVTIKVLLADGTRLELSGLDQHALEVELQRRLEAGE